MTGDVWNEGDGPGQGPTASGTSPGRSAQNVRRPFKNKDDNMPKASTNLLRMAIGVLVLVLCSACGRSKPAPPTPSPTAATETLSSTTTPTATVVTPSPSPTFTPGPEPQIVLLRGAPGCEREHRITPNSPVQLHYGIWGSTSRDYAEASWDSIEVTLTIDGETIEGEKQPVAPDLVNHCGGDAEGTYWMFYNADIESIPPGLHHLEVIYSATGVIEDGTGQSWGPGIFLTNSFVLHSTQLSEGEMVESPILSAPSVERFPKNPIIIPEMLPLDDGSNINGPSLIRVPSWVENPLGKYYLYFAHHIGTYIRLAYADDLAGPWNIYPPGTLRLEDTVCKDIYGSIYADYKHLASPDVHVDDDSQQIRMYFHCPVYLAGPVEDDSSYRQVTLLATSSDGLNFEASSKPLGDSYFRVFQWGGYTYALSMPGVFYRSADGLTNFEQGPTLFSEDMRHSAVLVQEGKLLVFYTMVGDTPERILLTEIELGHDWMTWSTADPVLVLEPELDWEGAELPLEPSTRGFAEGPVRQLRDPAIFLENGHTYLLYAVAGESGIAIAALHWPDR